MAFEALEMAIEMAAALREPLVRLQTHDADLAKQARRAASSVALCISEGQRRGGKDRRHLFRVAAGSAAEVRTALRLALAWGYLEPSELAAPLALVDRELAMLYRMTN